MTARVIAIANRKGGVGKTTTAVNVAAELADRGRRILLIDMDPQGHAGLGVGVVRTKTEAAVHHLFRPQGIDLGTAVRPSCVPGIDVLPAEADFQVHEAVNDPLRLIRGLAAFGNRYDEIVIDTSPTIDITTLAALAAADHVLIPTQLQYLAYDGVLRFSSILLKVATLLNPRFSGLAVVPIQIDMRTNIQRVVLAKLLMNFGPKRIFRGIRTDVALAEAFGARTPVRLYRPSARGAADYALLADDILTFWRGEPPLPDARVLEEAQAPVLEPAF
jgi:chromosome partitioning protein